MNSPIEHKQAIARHYDSQVEYWRDAYVGQREVFASYALVHRRDLVLRLVDEFVGGESPRTADIGCGAGALMIELLERGHQVTGLDISEKMVVSVRRTVDERFPGRGHCVVGDADALPFENGSFDCVVSVGVLSHQTDPRHVVAELGRVVEDNGLVIVTLANVLRLQHLLDPLVAVALISDAIRRIRRSSPGTKRVLRYSARGDAFAVRKYLLGEFKAIFEGSGLVIRETIPCTFGPPTYWRKTVFGIPQSVRLSSIVERMAARRGFGFLKLFANEWIICLEKSEDAAKRGASKT